MTIIMERLEGLEHQIRQSMVDGKETLQRRSPIQSVAAAAAAPRVHPPRLHPRPSTPPPANIHDVDGQPGRWHFPGPSTMPSPEPDSYAGENVLKLAVC